MMQDQNKEANCSSPVSDQEDPSDCTMEDACNQAIAKSEDDRLFELESEVSLLTNAIIAFFQQGDRGIVDVLRQRGAELPEKWQVPPLAVQEKKQEEDTSQQERQEHRKDDAPCEPEKSRSKIVTAFRALTCPGEAPDQSPDTEHLFCKIERLEREKEKTARYICKLHEELDRTSRISNQNYKHWEGANHRLKQNIERLEMRIENVQHETKLANRRASNATAAHQRLYQLLESAVVKRKDKAGQRSFPSGDDILSRLRISQKYAEDFFYDLVDVLIVGRDSNAQDYYAILSDVLAPAAQISQEYHTAWVSHKEAQLAALIEDHNQFENPLTRLFTSATMQRLVQKRVQQAHQDDGHQEFKLKDHTRYPQYPKLLRWALSDEVGQDNEMDGKSVESFFQELVHLYGVCEFSDPPCYLYPPVGLTVPYFPDHHVQRISKTLSTKAKPRDSVRVLHPGLYYENPERNPKAKPVQKALVVCFNEPSIMGEGEKKVKRGFGNKAWLERLACVSQHH